MTSETIRKAALAILSSDTKLTRNSGSFLGQCVATGAPMTDKQEEWFLQLADKAGVSLEGIGHE